MEHNNWHLSVSQTVTKTVANFFCVMLQLLLFITVVHLYMCISHCETLLFWLGSSISLERQENARQHGWKISHIEGLEGSVFVCVKGSCSLQIS